MLLKGVEDMRKYLGRTIMSATSDEFLTPFIEQAQEDVFERALGMDFLIALDNLYNDEPLVPSDMYVEVLKKVQRSLAWFAYLRYLPYSIGNDGDNGLQEFGTDSTQPVRIGVLDRRMRETERNAVNSLESLLVFLDSNLNLFPEYANSDFIKEARALFVPSATVMSEYLPQIAGNYRLFLTLRPWIKLAEMDYILPRIGQAQYDRLKSGLREQDLTPIEKELMAKIRRALSHTAYWIALPSLQLVVLGNGNLRILSDFDGIYNSKAPSNDVIMAMTRTAETEAKKWQNGLRAFLGSNLDSFPLYAASDIANQEPTNRLPDNDIYKSIFRMK